MCSTVFLTLLFLARYIGDGGGGDKRPRGDRILSILPKSIRGWFRKGSVTEGESTSEATTFTAISASSSSSSSSSSLSSSSPSPPSSSATRSQPWKADPTPSCDPVATKDMERMVEERRCGGREPTRTTDPWSPSSLP